MKDWMFKVILYVLLPVLAIVAIGSTLVFTTETDVYLIKNPTEEQMERVISGDPENRVWTGDANLVYQGSSLIQVDFRARMLEDHRIPEFLDKLGVEYQLLRKNTGRR